MDIHLPWYITLATSSIEARKGSLVRGNGSKGRQCSQKQMTFCYTFIQEPSISQWFYPATDGDRCRGSQLKIKRSSWNPMEEDKEGLKKPEGSSISQEIDRVN